MIFDIPLTYFDIEPIFCQNMALGRCYMTAAGLGLEPRYTVPETVVLPLDDPAIFLKNLHRIPENTLFSSCLENVFYRKSFFKDV